MSARVYALHSLCPRISFPFPCGAQPTEIGVSLIALLDTYSCGRHTVVQCVNSDHLLRLLAGNNITKCLLPFNMPVCSTHVRVPLFMHQKSEWCIQLWRQAVMHPRIWKITSALSWNELLVQYAPSIIENHTHSSRNATC